MSERVAITREETQKLLQRLFASRHFVHATSLRKILEFICEHTLDPNSYSLKEYEIAVGANLRPSSFDPKSDPIIRVSISGIRERLATYFDNAGRNEAVHLSIPKGEYRVVFTKAVPKEPEDPGAVARRAFWADYAGEGKHNLMLYAETLFFHDDKGNFIRNILVNDPHKGLDEIDAHWPGLAEKQFRPCYHFVPAGEMHCVLTLQAAFAATGIPLESVNARFMTWGDLRDANLVLLGSPRINPFVATMGRDDPFVVQAQRILNTKPQEGETAEYVGRRFAEGNLERSTDYALITRKPAMVGGGTVTIVSSNHGRGIEGAGDFLARDEQLQAMVARLAAGPGGDIPTHFQVLLRVEMIDFDEEVVEVEYVTHRVMVPKE